MGKVLTYVIPAAPNYQAASDFVIVFDDVVSDLRLARLTSSFDAPFEAPQELSEFSIHELMLLKTSIEAYMKSEYFQRSGKSQLSTIYIMVDAHLSGQVINRLRVLDKRSRNQE